MNYDELLKEAEEDNIYVIEDIQFESKVDGLINGSVIGLSKKIDTSNKKSCVLAEELGHYYTTVGDITAQSQATNRKQELRARLWAYNKLVGLNGIINAYKHGCHSLHETAEYLNVTEEFLLEALERYKTKYGEYTKIDNYIIYFEPRIIVFEMI